MHMWFTIYMNNISDEIIKTIKYALDRKAVNCDRTYKSIIKNINKKGYVVLNETSNERTVKCCILGVELKIGQSVWVKEPLGKLNDLHICGVMGKLRV